MQRFDSMPELTLSRSYVDRRGKTVLRGDAETLEEYREGQMQQKTTDRARSVLMIAIGMAAVVITLTLGGQI